MHKKNNGKGFTTVELVIVIAVIAILATVLIPTFSNLIDKANDSSAMQQANAAYTTYTTDFDYTKGSLPETNILIVVSNSSETKYFIVKNNHFNSKAFKNEADALKAFEDGKIYTKVNGALDGVTVDGVTFYKVELHTHNFVDGICSCGQVK